MSMQKPSAPSTPTISPTRPAKRQGSKSGLSVRPPSFFSSKSSSSPAISPIASPLTNPYSSSESSPVNTRDYFSSNSPKQTQHKMSASKPSGAQQSDPLISWINSKLPAGKQASSYSSSFRNGELVYLLVKSVSGKTKSELEKLGVFKEITSPSGSSFDHVDPLLDLFDFLLDLEVPTDDVSVAEILRGDGKQTKKLLSSIQSHF
jgi:hypothetical protein